LVVNANAEGATCSGYHHRRKAREVGMKRNHYQKRADELRKVRDIFSDIDNASEKELRNIDLSIFYGDDRRCLDEIVNRASQYLELKQHSDTDELGDWFVSKAEAFEKLFRQELRL
jgi:hypothetical protein